MKLKAMHVTDLLSDKEQCYLGSYCLLRIDVTDLLSDKEQYLGSYCLLTSDVSLTYCW
jgi:hypothetical protein